MLLSILHFISALEMSYPSGWSGQASWRSEIDKPSIPKSPFWTNLGEHGDMLAKMSPAWPLPSFEALPTGISSSKNPPSTQNSSGSWGSEQAHSSVFDKPQQYFESFSSSQSLESVFNNLNCRPLMPSHFDTLDPLGYFNSYDEPCYTQSIVSSPRPSCTKPYFSTNIQAHQFILPPAGRPCPLAPGLNDHGPQSLTDRDSGRQSRMDLNIRKDRLASSIHAGDEGMFVCCGIQFSNKSSFNRHRKGSCKTFQPAGKRFQCDPDIHCRKAFLRRCGLKNHLAKTGRSKKEVDEVVRRKYGKGMHRLSRLSSPRSH